jgi:hypothetical protein
LRSGQYVFFAVGSDAFQIVFFPEDAADLAAVDVVFRGGEAQYAGQ